MKGPKKPVRGFTLMEMIIAAAVLAIILLGAQSLMVSGQKESTASFKRHMLQSNLQVIGGSLQKFMSGSDLKFLAFSALGAADRILSRAIIPLPGRCRNLTIEGCGNQTSLLYVHYDKSISPAISVVCAHNSGSSWLVDRNYTSYGTSTFADDVFNVDGGANNISGPVTIVKDTVLALMDPPTASLWVADGKPKEMKYTQSAADGSIVPPLPADCDKSKLQRSGTATNGEPLYKLDGLVEVSVAPLSLGQFTGGAGVTAAERMTAYGSFPLRTFVTTLRTVGPLPKGPAGEFEFGMSHCVPTEAGIDCSSLLVSGPDQIKGTRIEESFAVRLGNSTAGSYQLLPAALGATDSCEAPGCVKMTVPEFPVPGMRVTINGTETIETLDPLNFSLMKQSLLKRIRFKLMLNQNREESIDAIFP